MKVITSFFFIIRPLISSIAGLVSTSIYITTTSNFSVLRSLLIFLVVTLTSGYGFILNDYFDIEKDKIGHPDRILPKAILSLKSALKLGGALGIISLILSAFLPTGGLLINLSVLLLLGIYSHINNHYGIWANAITAIICSFVPIFGMVSGGFNLSILIVSIGTFFLIFGREIILDIRDLYSDKKIGKTSIPILLGEKNALYITTTLFLISTLCIVVGSLYTMNLFFILFVGIIANFLLWSGFLYYLIDRTLRRLNTFRLFTQLSFLSFVLGILL